MIVIAPSAQIDFMVGVPLQAEAKHTFMPHATGAEGKAARDAAFSPYVCFSLNNATYVRETGEIQATIPWEVEDDEETGRLAFEPDTINYLRYKNVPFDDRWHYCFVNRVSYINNNNFRFEISEDYWQTWGLDVTFHPSYINRMHSPSDGIGENLVPENLDTGRLIIEEDQGVYALVDDMGRKTYDNMIVVISTFGFNSTRTDFLDWWGGKYGGYYSGLNYIGFKDMIRDVPNPLNPDEIIHIDATKEEMCNAFLIAAQFKNKIDGIVGIYCIPDMFATVWRPVSIPLLPSIIPDDPGQEFATFIYFDLSSDPIQEHLCMASPKFQSASGEYPGWPNKTIDNKLSGYTVHNNKLFTYPYCFIQGTNLNGSEMNYRYEWFDSGARPTFFSSMVLAGKPGVTSIPENYLGMEEYEEGKIVSENFAPCPYLTDSYAVYLGQLISGGGQIRQAGNILSNVVSAASGSFSGKSGITMKKYASGETKPTKFTDQSSWSSNFASNPGSLIEAPFNVAAGYQAASNAADRVGSSAEFGYMEALKKTNIAYFPVHISEEYARKIDRYFSMFGYAYAGIAMPDILSRTHWNYLECQQPVIQSSVVPQEAVQAMKNSITNGITFWHNIGGIGQYNLYVDGTGELDNPIYTP